jgi:type II secretory pathway pseudopilin PulG
MELAVTIALDILAESSWMELLIFAVIAVIVIAGKIAQSIQEKKQREEIERRQRERQAREAREQQEQTRLGKGQRTAPPPPPTESPAQRLDRARREQQQRQQQQATVPSPYDRPGPPSRDQQYRQAGREKVVLQPVDERQEQLRKKHQQQFLRQKQLDKEEKEQRRQARQLAELRKRKKALRQAELMEQSDISAVTTIHDLRLDDPENVRLAVIYSEILQPPKAIRKRPEPWDL